MIPKIKAYLKTHKLAAIFVVAILGYIAYRYGYSGSTAQVTKYILGVVERGNVISTVSGSGQVASTNQVDIKPKVSAEIKLIKVIAGQKVKKGDVLASLDDKDLVSSVRQAQDSFSINKANLDLKLAGLTKEDLLVAQKSLEASRIAYDTAVNSLASTKESLAETLRKAELQFANVQISYNNAESSYKNSISSGDVTQSNSSASYANAYSDARNTLGSSLLSMRSALLSADSILGIDHDPVNANLKDVLSVRNSVELTNAKNDYAIAREKVSAFEIEYNAVGKNPTNAQVENLLSKASAVFEPIKLLEHDTYNALLNTITSSNVSQSNLDSYRASISSAEAAAVSAQNNLEKARQTIVSAKNAVTSGDLSVAGSVVGSKASLETARNNLTAAASTLNQAKIDYKKNLDAANTDVLTKKNSWESAKAQFDLKVAKPRAVDLASLQVQVSQAATSLSEAKSNLGEASVKAPIDGVVAKVYQKVSDTAGPATILITIITPKQLATISLNEVDVAKVKSGQKANLTFSAIDGLEITGEVSDVDALGTVTSGVVTYNVNIALDTQDDRIKPQMSASADIVTGERIGVLIVPNSAIKTDSNSLSYVEILASPSQADTSGQVTSVTAPSNQFVEIGVTNDTSTEIKSGLKEGDRFITRTIAGTAAKATTQAGGIGGLFGGNRGGGASSGAAMRAIR